MIHLHIRLFLFLFICNDLIMITVSASANDNGILAKCKETSRMSCGACLRADPQCVWIYEEKMPDNLTRCTMNSEIEKLSLSPEITKIIKSSDAKLEVLIDDNFRLPQSGDLPAIQIRPQRIKLFLRQHKNVTFQLRYKALTNYPLDIYYLLDQTYTMAKHREQLQEIGDKLAGNLTLLTKHYQIAFGYFSDKVAMPYYAMAEKILANPCLVIDGVGECAPGSNFVHSLNFTMDTNAFNRQVASFNFTANMDDLEGGLDALMQVILCQKQFGWRRHSRKMIILATDGFIHTAGDGLLGGAVKKMEPRCMMTQKNGMHMYDGLEYDYPSIEEVTRRLEQNKMAVVLAVQEKETGGSQSFEYYKAMNLLMHRVSTLVFLDKNSENIVETVQKGFQNVVEQVKFRINAPEYIQATSWSYCNNETKSPNETWACWDVELNKEYIFNVTIQLMEVPKENRTQIITIEEGHIHEKLEIEVEFLEYCDCIDDVQKLDPDIHGSYSCGIYICDPGWSGEKCNEPCSRDTGRLKTDNFTSATCSNNGVFDESQCGCICDRNFMGEYCEYPQCETNNLGEICNKQGDCQKGQCACYEGFTGDICNCTTVTHTCRVPGQQVNCALHGNCVCGECVCDYNNNVKYFGKYCEHCTGCHSCRYNDVLTRHLAGGFPSDELYQFTEQKDPEDFECKFWYSPNSTHECELSYSFDIKGTIDIAYYQSCTTAEMYYMAGSSIVIAVLCILLTILFIWRICVYFQDKRGYAKFEKDLEGTKFASNENILYLSPIRSYANPNVKQE